MVGFGRQLDFGAEGSDFGAGWLYFGAEGLYFGAGWLDLGAGWLDFGDSCILEQRGCILEQAGSCLEAAVGLCLLSVAGHAQRAPGLCQPLLALSSSRENSLLLHRALLRVS